MKTYNEHFELARAAYKEENRRSHQPPTDKLYNFAFWATSPILSFDRTQLINTSETENSNDRYVILNDQYMTYVDSIAKELSGRLQQRDACWFPPGLDENLDFAVRIKNIWNIKYLEELCEYVVPQIEEKLFGSYAYLEGVYAYKNVYKASPPRSSWIWHYDNHPRETVKVMIYLSDVCDKSGAFETLTTLFGELLKGRTSRIDHTKWLTSNTRVSDAAIQENIAKGCKASKILGSQGTLCLFDNNIVHRASIPEPGYERPAIVLMLRPAIKKMRPYISEDWTGTNYHIDVWKDPSHVGVQKRC